MHGLPSSQSASVAQTHELRPSHTPSPLHVVGLVHASSSSQTAPISRFSSTGHSGSLPLQYSGASHARSAASSLRPRHNVPCGSTASAGHSADTPVHRSATSHDVSPRLARHTTLGARNASAGHSALEPVQLSAISLH